MFLLLFISLVSCNVLTEDVSPVNETQDLEFYVPNELRVVQGVIKLPNGVPCIYAGDYGLDTLWQARLEGNGEGSVILQGNTVRHYPDVLHATNPIPFLEGTYTVYDAVKSSGGAGIIDELNWGGIKNSTIVVDANHNISIPALGEQPINIGFCYYFNKNNRQYFLSDYGITEHEDTYREGVTYRSLHITLASFRTGSDGRPISSYESVVLYLTKI